MKKVTYIISNIKKALEFEWAATELKKLNYDINFILLNPGNSEMEQFLNKNDISFYRIKYAGKSNLFAALLKTIQLLKSTKPDIIHCHLFEASLIGLFAAWLCGIKNRIHTRHHSIWHHRYYPHALKYDKINNFLSTKIVAVSNVVKNILLKEGVNKEKIVIINHGIDPGQFQKVDSERVYALKKKYNTLQKGPVIGVISRFTVWKGVQYIVPAFKNLLNLYPNSLLILSNAKGDYETEIITLLKTLPENSYRLIEFENDLFAFYKLFDIFVHVPIDNESEAFGQIYIEAMAAGIPLICTRSGIANELAIDGYNSLVVNYEDSEDIYNSLIKLLQDSELAKYLSENAQKSVQNYTLEMKIYKLNQLYNCLTL